MWSFPVSCPITKKEKGQRIKEGGKTGRTGGKIEKRTKKRKRGGGRKRLGRKERRRRK